MNESPLFGSIKVSKRLRQHAVWLREPPSYGQAWIDLLMLANDRDRHVTVRGEQVLIKRGQLAWSQRSLEREWQRSGEWISGFLRFCQDNSMLTLKTTARSTIITIINYDAYQFTETVSEPGAEPDVKTVTEPGQKVEGGTKNMEQVKGEAPAPNAECDLPSLTEVITWARSGAEVDPDYAEIKWSTVTENHGWVQNGRVIDWRARFKRFWDADREKWLAKKTPAPGFTDGAPPIPPGYAPASIAEMMKEAV